MNNNKSIVNIFQIVNIDQLSCQYKLFEIKGISTDSKDFYATKQALIRNLSRELKHPIEVITKNEKPYLVAKNDAEILKKIPKEHITLKQRNLCFSETPDIYKLDFQSTNKQDRAICRRFLQFSIQGALFKRKNLWQPGSGKPFFIKRPETKDSTDIYKGFSVRVVDLENNGWGIVIDVTRKFVSSIPINNYITKQDFDRKYNGKIVLYKSGDQWYEIKLSEWNSLNVSEHKYPNDRDNGNIISLIEDLRKRCSTPHPKLLANLPNDASVLFYFLPNGEPRAVPAGLCFPVQSTEDGMSGYLHRKSVLPPHIRKNGILFIKENFLERIKFGEQKVKLSNDLIEISKSKFNFPDIEFGNNDILEYRNTTPKQFSKQRANRILDGGYLKPTQPNLGPQYIFLPRSIHDTFGKDFTERLIQATRNTYPWHKYNPTIHFYDDIPPSVNSYVSLGKSIVKQIQQKVKGQIASHALVMIPSIKKNKRDHDKLSALLKRELVKSDCAIIASIIHSDTVSESYKEISEPNGAVKYAVRKEKKGKINGYVKNVSLTKILLNNRKYPFALNTPLNADLTIGIDVKDNNAGFVYIDKFAKNICTDFISTNQKEKLSSTTIFKHLYESIKNQSQFIPNIQDIVIHRDGRIYNTEIDGVNKALCRLKEENILLKDATISIIEIHKNSFLPIRFFDLTSHNKVQNPEIGTYYEINDKTAFICTTGEEFLRNGTAKPLMIQLINGQISFREILQDVFSLSTLAFTKLDDCSRLPFSIKALDTMLYDSASSYDEESFNYADYEELNIETIKPQLILN